MNRRGQIKKFGISVLIVGILLIGIVFAGDLIGNNKDDIIQLNDGTKIINFTWTDNNTDEEFIIYSDYKMYSSDTNTIIRYLAINNSNSKSEKAYLKSAYEQNKGLENNVVSIWDKTKWKVITKENTNIEVINQTFNVYKYTEVSCKDYGLIKDMYGKCYVSNLVDTYNISTDKYKDKEKDLLKTKPVKDYIAKEKFEINLNIGMNYIKIDTGVPIGYEGEFFDELFGEYGSYGHLDPFIQFEPPTLDDSASTINNWTAINITINESNLETMIYNWNGTNFTFYNDSLKRMFNFDSYTLLNDTSQSAVDLVNHGATFNATGGKFNGYYNFSGSDYMDVGTSGSILHGLTKFAFEAWVKPDGDYSDYRAIYYVGGSNNNFAVQLKTTTGTFNAYLNGGTACYPQTTKTLTPNVWSHIATVNDGSTMKLYINGIEEASVSCSNTLIDNDQVKEFGRFIGYDSHYFRGGIDKIRMWSRALTPEEVNQSYMSNLRKFSDEDWELYTNQTESPNQGLADGTYTYQGWAEDTGSSWNTTGERTVNIGADTNPPTYSGFITNITYANRVAQINLTIDDNLLETNGQYIISNNNTGTWVNGSTTNFTETPQTISQVLTLNDTIGNTVCWKYYVSDDAGNKNFTASLECITLTNPAPTLKRCFSYHNGSIRQTVACFYDTLKWKFYGDVEIDGDLKVNGNTIFNDWVNISHGNYLKVGNINPDITENRIMAEGGFATGSGFGGKNHDWAPYFKMYSSTATKIKEGDTGKFIDESNIFCDSVSNNFEASDATRPTKVLILLNGTHRGAVAEINSFINSSCIELEKNPGWDADVSGIQWVIKDGLKIHFNDGEAYKFVVGNHEESLFKIGIPNGTGDTGAYIYDKVGASNHKAFLIDQDMNGFSTIAQNIHMYSSSQLVNKSLIGLLIEGDASNMNASSGTFIDMRVIGAPLVAGHMDGIKMPTGMEHLIHVGSTDTLSSAYYNNINITSNATDTGTDVTVFEADNDIIYIGNEINFTSLSIALSTEASTTIAPLYYYCDSDHTWQSLSAIDSTNGFQISGTISFSNPEDRGNCSHEIDGTPFSDTTNYTYIAIKRTRNNVNTPPVINRIDISGGSSSMFLSEDLMKLNPIDTAPETCDAQNLGAIYFDISEDGMCQCKSTGWKVIEDGSACT